MAVKTKSAATLPDALRYLDFCVVDTETTGGRADDNQIIDLAILHYRDGIILDRYETLLNPGRRIPEWITMLTGITDQMVANAPRFDEVAEEAQAFLEKGVFVAHNAGFDYSFLREEFSRVGIAWERPTVCTVRLARHLYPELPSRSLGNLCEHLLIDIWNRHRAMGDAEATVYVLKELLRKLDRDHGVRTWPDLEVFTKFGPLILPPRITMRLISSLPEKPGQFLFRNAQGEVIQKGSGKNLSNRIRQIFRRSNQSERSNRLRELAHTLEIL